MAQATRRLTLSRFMETAWRDSPELEGLDAVVSAIAAGGREIQRQIQLAALADVLGSTGDTNSHGEAVQRLDQASSDVLVDLLARSGRVAAIGCEELERPEIVDSSDPHRFIVQMDPLDGSSNIDVAVTVGSIFGIWARNPGEAVTEESMLKPGKEQVAAAYLVYGSSTVMVVATPGSVNGFTLDIGTGAFELTHPNIRLAPKAEYYSANEGNVKNWNESLQRAVAYLRQFHSLRYIGSLVADFHRNLLKGGIFLYPGDSKYPDGKLRLMYEANPLAYVIEQAGGAATDSRERILDIQPQKSHQRVPLYIGNTDAVTNLLGIMKGG